MRLIDADALMETFETKAVLAWVKNIVNNAPTIDAVQVVRCADCIYWEEIECSEYGFCNRAMDIRPHGTVYCAFGERKDGADNG